MALKLKDLPNRAIPFTGGHRACSGCGFPMLIKMVLAAADGPVVVGNSTGCMEVTTTIFPYTAWKTSYIHNAFENVAATISGVEAAYQSLKRRGHIDRDIKFLAFGGDGGTYDIGLQSLSGAMERGHNMVYVCYDNEAYMNTGIQRSSATPRGANTTTSPFGQVSSGKQQYRKDLTAIMAAHDIPYVAQAAISHWQDLVNKAQKAFAVEGPAFLNVLTSCRLGWAIPPEDAVDAVDGGVQSCFWPLYEVENGNWKLNYKPKKKLPMDAWMKQQGRFKHLFSPGMEKVRQEIQEEVDRRWKVLLKKCGEEVEEPEAPEP